MKLAGDVPGIKYLPRPSPGGTHSQNLQQLPNSVQFFVFIGGDIFYIFFTLSQIL